MVRNLHSMKTWPPRPGRSWRKRTGDPIVTRMHNAIAAITGRKMSRAGAAKHRSKSDFRKAGTPD
jgi:hypothetical protein